MTGVDTLLARGYIDQRNLFVQGASGGGVLTGWIVGHTQRFTAAVARAMVSDFFSWAGTVDRSRWFSDTFAKTPWDDPQERLRRSPIMYVNNVTTPTLVMTGELDLRTPVSQAEEFYRALRMRKVPTAMIRIADAYHNQGATLSNFMRVQLYMRNWFERFMVRDGTTNSGALQQAARTESPGSAAATAAATLTEAAHADGVAPYGVECVNYK
jgi:dipeptidyl aminopeptidase/acylaminoacyl peptidase